MDFATAIAQTCAGLERHPEKGAATFTADHTLTGMTEVDAEIRTHRVTIDEPPSLGGADAGPNPVELVLAGLGGCQAIALRVWAAKLDIAFDQVRVRVEGDLDVRGFFGVDESVRPGFSAIRVHAEISGPESSDRYDELYKAVEAHCPVQDIVTNGVPVTSGLTVTAS